MTNTNSSLSLRPSQGLPWPLPTVSRGLACPTNLWGPSIQPRMDAQPVKLSRACTAAASWWDPGVSLTQRPSWLLPCLVKLKFREHFWSIIFFVILGYNQMLSISGSDNQQWARVVLDAARPKVKALTDSLCNQDCFPVHSGLPSPHSPCWGKEACCLRRFTRTLIPLLSSLL